MDEPTDEEIEARLRATGEEAWDDLWAAARDVERETEHVTWGGGRQRDGVIQMPYAIYSAASERLHTALGRVGAIVPFRWRDWDGLERYRGRTALDGAPVADAVRMVTAIIRAERFSDGTIAAMLDDGTLLAAVRRLRRWHDDERA